MALSLWEQLELVRILKTMVHGWEAVGDMEGDTATYTAEYGRIHYVDSRRDYYLGLGELRQVAKLPWSPQKLGDYLEACDTLVKQAKATDDLASLIHEDGRPFVHVLAGVGEARLLSLLSSKDPAWTSTCPRGALPVHHAAQGGRPDTLKAVYKRIPKSKRRGPLTDDAGFTPLHWLAIEGGPMAVPTYQAMREYGAHHHVKTKKARDGFPKGSTAAAIARQQGHIELADLLDAQP